MSAKAELAMLMVVFRHRLLVHETSGRSCLTLLKEALILFFHVQNDNVVHGYFEDFGGSEPSFSVSPKVHWESD